MEKFYSVELDKVSAEKLKAFLKEKGIYFEPSSCYNLVHFEIKLSKDKLQEVEEFLNTL